MKITFPLLILSVATVSACTDRYPAPAIPASLVSPAEVKAIEEATTVKTSAADARALEHYDPFLRSHKDFRHVVYFETGQADLGEEELVALEALVKRSAKYNDYEFRISGHADRHGKSSANDALSEKRAGMVRSYLIDRGVANAKILMTAHGEESPAVVGVSKYGDRKNRRVEVELHFVPDTSQAK